uniref:Uncharacterized protein n=1 Tax=Arundo donax TaxID=35708 RepID=A0A0A9CJI6_ARUDO
MQAIPLHQRCCKNHIHILSSSQHHILHLQRLFHPPRLHEHIHHGVVRQVPRLKPCLLHLPQHPQCTVRLAQFAQGRDQESIHALVRLDPGADHFVEQPDRVPVHPFLEAGPHHDVVHRRVRVPPLAPHLVEQGQRVCGRRAPRRGDEQDGA